jgi:hypothetical protein
MAAVPGLVDGTDLADPRSPFGVFQSVNLLVPPMEVVGDEGYLSTEIG